MPLTDDRTAEFFAIADARCQLRGRPPNSRPKPQRTAFGAASSRVGQAIHELQGRVDRLARLTGKTSLFDDPAVEIADISSLVKSQLGAIGQTVEALARGGRPGGAQFAVHAEAVLSYLKAGLQRGTEGFQAALEQREAILCAKEARAVKLSSLAATPATPLHGSHCGNCGGGPSGCGIRSSFACASGVATPQGSSSLLQRRRPHPAYSTPHAAAAQGDSGLGGCGAHGSPAGSSVAIDMGGMSGLTPAGQQQQQTFWTPRSRKHRQEEMSQMQSTLAELGGMFQKFTALVAEQVGPPR
jgi:syntaxin 5